MTTQPPFQPSEWGALADASEEAQRSKMRELYTQLLSLPEEQRTERMTEMVQVEYQLPDEKLRTFTTSRLLVWLEMAREEGRAVAATYDWAMRRMSASDAMKRVAIVQTVCRDFTDEQLDQLYELIPSIIQELPRKLGAVSLGARVPTTKEAPKARKPWWKLW